MSISEGAFWLALFFLFGVALASFQLNLYWAFALMAASALFLFYYQCRFNSSLSTNSQSIINRRHYLTSALILPIFIFIGFFYFYFFEAWHQEKIVFDQTTEITGLIAESPQLKLQRQEFFVEFQPPFQGRARVYAAVQPIYQYGDFIRLKGKITKNPSGSNQIFFPQIELVEEGRGSSLRFKLFNLKSRLIANLNRVLPPSSAALASGMIFGDRSRFQPDFEKNLIETGTLHLTALSGLHIMIIVASLQNLLLSFTSKRKSFYLTFLIILFFVLMTGSRPSAVRAAFMGSLAAASRQWSRLYNPRNAVVLTALIMVLFNPRLLVFNLGFQLSFLALLGIIYFSPFLSRLIKKDNLTDDGFFYWKDTAAITLSAQAAVLPFLFFKFGQFSWFSVLPNILILPLMPITILGGFLTAVAGFVFYPLSALMGSILNLLLSYEMGVINFFAAYF